MDRRFKVAKSLKNLVMLRQIFHYSEMSKAPEYSESQPQYALYLLLSLIIPFTGLESKLLLAFRSACGGRAGAFNYASTSHMGSIFRWSHQRLRGAFRCNVRFSKGFANHCNLIAGKSIRNLKAYLLMISTYQAVKIIDCKRWDIELRISEHPSYRLATRLRLELLAFCFFACPNCFRQKTTVDESCTDSYGLDRMIAIHFQLPFEHGALEN